MRRLALLGILLCSRALAAPPALSPATAFPGDAVIGGAWGEQAAPDIAAGSGQLLAVWSDDRASEGRSDIYGIRLDASGRPVDPVAFVIDQADGAQRSPLVAWNGTDWLVAWLDEGRVTATRVAPSGTILDVPPIYVATPGPATAMALASDGSSWALIWAGTDAGNADVRGARIAGDGTLLDPGGSVVVPETFFIRAGFTLAFAGDRYLLAWPEDRGVNWDDIVGLTLTSTLTPRESAPFVIASSPNPDLSPALASNGTGFYLAWKETDRSVWVNGIDGTPVSLDGVALVPAGVPLGDRRSYGEFPDVAWDGTQWIVGFTALDAVAMRVGTDGTPVDAVPVILASAAAFDMRDIALAGLPGGGAQAAWQDYRNHRENDITGAVLRADGTASADARLSLGLPSQQNAQAVANGNGHAVAFESRTSDRVRILVQRVDAARNSLDPEPVEVAAGDLTEPGLAWSGQRYLVTWRDRGTSRIFARRLDAGLAFQDAAPIDLGTGENPSVAALGDAFLVTMEKPLSTWQFREVFAQRVDGATGTLVGGLINLPGGYAWASTVGVVGSSWLVAWEAHQAHDDTIYRLSMAFVAADGTLGPASGLEGGSGWGVSGVAIASHDTQGAIAYSTTTAPSASNGEVRLVRVLADGALPDGTSGVLLSGDSPLEQFAPAAAWTGSEFLVAWQDTRNNPDLFFFPRCDVYGARMAADGSRLDDPAGFAIESTPVPETMPAVAGGGGDPLVVASRLVGADVGALRLGLRGLLPGAEPLPPVTGVRLERGGRITWDSAGTGISYDVVRGSVHVMHANRSVIDGSCLADDQPSPFVTDPELPGLGQGFYYIIRADSLAPGTGTYDDPPGGVQGHSRDDDQGPAACTDLQ